MRFGIIDLGTNSVRFDIHQLSSDGKLRQLHREKIMVRLGQNVFIRGKLDPAAVKRTLLAFVRFRLIADRFQTDRVVALGTSALRDASDQRPFIELISKRTGIQVQVISGVEEARLIALGILTNERPFRGRTVLVDIGGGSTEISICKGHKVLHSWSLPMGTARLQQVFLRQSPPQRNNVQELRSYLRATLRDHTVGRGLKLPKIDRMIGSSGTIRALAKMLRKRGCSGGIERDSLVNLVEEMSQLNQDELSQIPGLEPKRLDMILAGAILFEECMRFFGARSALATEFTLRDGILAEEASLMRKREASHLSLHMDELYSKAAFFGVDLTRTRRLVRLGEIFYKKLSRVHQLDSNWMLYLKAAIILRNVGSMISPADQGTHSYYIIRNIDLPRMESWEHEFIAQLCLYHERGEPDLRVLHFRKDSKKCDAFMKVLAILQILDALDSGPNTRVRLSRVRVVHRQVEIHFAGKRLMGTETLNLGLKKGFFDKVFQKPLKMVLSSRSSE